MKIELSVCNVCKEPGKAVTTYEVARNGGTYEIELCQEDGAPLEELLTDDTRVRPQAARKVVPAPQKATPMKHVPRKPAASRRAGTRIMTLAEIEEAKKAQRRG